MPSDGLDGDLPHDGLLSSSIIRAKLDKAYAMAPSGVFYQEGIPEWRCGQKLEPRNKMNDK